MPKIKHSWVWVVPIWERAQWVSAQMGTTQTQLCFIWGIWVRFGIIISLLTPLFEQILQKWDLFIDFYYYFYYRTSPLIVDNTS